MSGPNNEKHAPIAIAAITLDRKEEFSSHIMWSELIVVPPILLLPFEEQQSIEPVLNRFMRWAHINDEEPHFSIGNISLLYRFWTDCPIKQLHLASIVHFMGERYTTPTGTPMEKAIYYADLWDAIRSAKENLRLVTKENSTVSQGLDTEA